MHPPPLTHKLTGTCGLQLDNCAWVLRTCSQVRGHQQHPPLPTPLPAELLVLQLQNRLVGGGGKLFIDAHSSLFRLQGLQDWDPSVPGIWDSQNKRRHFGLEVVLRSGALSLGCTQNPEYGPQPSPNKGGVAIPSKAKGT